MSRPCHFLIRIITALMIVMLVLAAAPVQAKPLYALGAYPNTSVVLGGNTTITPSVAPTGTTSINVSTNTNFKGTFVANTATGVVRVINAHPAGTYTVTVRAFGATPATTTFTLTVTNGAPCITTTVNFTGPTNIAAGTSLFSVAVGDFDNNGNQDLAAANLGANAVSIFIGNGVGGFGGATNYAMGNQPVSVAVGDFDNNGNQDIVTANSAPGSTTITVRLGNGAGGFGGATNYNMGTQPYFVVVGDFNNDGRQDLATPNLGSNNVSVRLGNGNGTFGGVVNYPVGTAPWSVAVGDFNNDTRQDLVVANSTSNNISILLGNGDGTFGVATNIAMGTSVHRVAVGDFNNNGNQDLAVSNNAANQIYIRLGNGDGTFGASANYPGGLGPWSVAVADFNNNGNQDFATADWNANNITIRLGNGNGTFGGAANFAPGTQPSSVAVGDFNNDGKQDFAAGNRGSNNLSIRLGYLPLCYIGNGSTGGAVPATVNYAPNALVTVAGVGTLVRAGYTFVGWNTATDGSGTPRTAGSTFNITTPTVLYAQWVSNIPPTITSATSTTLSGSYNVPDAINIRLNFSKSISSAGLTINLNSGGSVTTGALTNVTSWSGTYTVGAGQNSADLTVSSITGTITDAIGNNTVDPTVPAGQNIADSKDIVIDTTTPTVTSATSITANGSYNVPDAINITVNFSESISSPMGLTINLNSGGSITTGALTNVTSYSGTYTVGAGQNSSDLTVSVILGVIIDAAGNGTGGPTTVPAGQNIANSKDIVIDTTAPTITSAASTTGDGSYNVPDAINITLNFSESISSAAGLAITLDTGAVVNTGPLNNVTSYSGTYTVGAGQTSTDLTVSSITGTITDAAGNPTANPTIPAGQNIANSKDIVIDTTAPSVTIVSVSPDPTNAGTTVTWHADEDGSYEVQVGGTDCSDGTVVDSGSYTAVTGDVATNIASGVLAPGTNTLRVCVTDVATNTGSDTGSVTQDTTAPSVTIVTVSPNPTNAGTTVTWNADEDGSYSVQVGGTDCSDGTVVDSGSYTAITGNVATNIASGSLSLGSNTLRVCVTDVATNTGSDTGSVTQDTTAPSVTIVSVSPDPTNAGTTITWHADKDGSYEVQVGGSDCSDGTVVDSGSYTAVSGDIATNIASGVLAPGANTLRVCVTDAATNTGADTGSVTQDTNAPLVVIDTISPNPTNAGTTLTWHADENGTYSVRIGGIDCTTGTQVGSGTYSTKPATIDTVIASSDLTAGLHDVHVCLADASGNLGTATDLIVKDTTLPTVTINTVSPNPTNTGTTVTWHADKDGSYEVRVGGSDCSDGTVVDSGSYTAVTGDVATNIASGDLSSGSNSLRVCVTDAATNTGSDTGSVTQDTTVPLVVIDTVSPDPTNAGTTVTWHADKNGSYSVRVGGTDCASGSEIANGSYTTTPATVATSIASGDLVAGANTVRVCVTDAATNTGAATGSVTLDTIAPLVVIDTVSPDPTNAGTTVTWHADKNGSYSVRVGGTDCASGSEIVTGSYTTAPATVASDIASGALAVGANTLRVCVTDAATNTGSASGTVTKDATYPIVIFGARTVPADGSTLESGPTKFIIEFNKDVLHDGSQHAANNLSNYLLLQPGPNGRYDVVSCSYFEGHGNPKDDVVIILSGPIVYTNNHGAGPFLATVTIDHGQPLPVGTYRLLICGSGSIQDAAGNRLNNGVDSRLNLIVREPPAAPVSVPATGFAPNRVTTLPAQTVSYADLGDLWLEIPALGVQMPIVGVPQADGEYDVTWLGGNAGWLNGSSFPTWAGNSVITGHVYDANGKPGPFAGLNRLWYGSQVIVHAWGGQYVYEVRSVLQVAPGDTAAMMKHQELPWLTLVTCRGYDQASNSYKYRVLVRAVLVEVK